MGEGSVQGFGGKVQRKETTRNTEAHRMMGSEWILARMDGSEWSGFGGS
jgi:hypothetical protein